MRSSSRPAMITPTPTPNHCSDVKIPAFSSGILKRCVKLSNNGPSSVPLIPSTTKAIQQETVRIRFEFKFLVPGGCSYCGSITSKQAVKIQAKTASSPGDILTKDRVGINNQHGPSIRGHFLRN